MLSDWYFKQDTATNKISICHLINSGRYTLDSLLAEVTGAQLCMLIGIFRGTEHWRKFLVALLRLSPEIWDRHYIFPEDVQKAFTPKEKETIKEIHSQMVTEGKHSPILLFL